MNMEELVVAIRVSAENADAAIESIKDGIESIGGSVETLNKEGEKAFEPMKRGANEAAAAQAALAAASATTFAAITKAVEDGTAAYNEFTAAQKGLQSIASGKGINQDALAKSLDGVTDAFLDAGSAATAYKNLLSRGYSLDQATTTIERLKDAAAFGRAANLSLADAVVTATEGIRQENSILVDNAGVTKNVAKMWEDYAKARGLTTASLTQAQKVEAEYLGIIQETQLQVGDLAKAADTLAGAQAENAAVSKELATTYGDALAPSIQYVTETGTAFLETVKGVVSSAPGLTAGITAAAAAMALYTTVAKAAATAQTILAAGTGIVSSPMMAIAAAIGVVTAGYTEYKKAQEEAAEAQEEAARVAKEEYKAQELKAYELHKQTGELEELAKEYEELTGKQELSISQQKRLDGIIRELAANYGISEEALRGLAGEYDTGNDAIADRIRMLEEERKAIIQTQIEQDRASLEQAKRNREIREAQQKAKIDAVLGASGLFEGVTDFSGEREFDNWTNNYEEWLKSVKKNVPDAYDEIKAASEEWLGAIETDTSKAITLYDAFLQTLYTELENLGIETDEIEARIEENLKRLEGTYTTIPGKTYGGSDGSAGSALAQNEKEALVSAQKAADAYRDQLDAIVASRETIEKIKTLEDENATLAEKQAAAIALQREGYGYLLGDAKAIAKAKEQASAADALLLVQYGEQRAALKGQLDALKAAYDAGDISGMEYVAMSAEINAALEQTQASALKAANAMEETEEAVEETDDAISKLSKDAEKTGRKLENALTFREEIRSMKSLAKEVKDAGGGWDAMSDEVKAFAKNMGVAEGDIDGAISALENMEAQTDSSILTMVSDLEGMLATLEATRAEILAIPTAELTADNTQALSVINATIAAVQVLLALFGKAGLGMDDGATKKRGGGGGNGKKDDGAEAARAAEQAQEEAYRAELERIEHRRRMNQITAQEEIRELERVKREYAKTAEQIMDIDERIYDARQALREEEQGKITTLYDSIVEALESRYEEQREIEQKRISDSIAAWEKWSDETCAAIQKQIDALDEQAEAEDREKTRAENLRKITSLEQALIYETDEYNQNQLKKQIEQAKAAWEEIQHGWEREDQRTELEKQMQAVQDQAQAEIDKLEEESERIDSVYDSMLEGASLAAEAQKLMMQSTQEDILQLLSEYAPDYEATGRTLGEKIYEGFKSAFGDISAFFEQIDAQFEAMTDKTQQAAFGKTSSAQAAGETIANVSSPTINQTVNFNQPVESPADVTRRMQQVSEELAGMM